MKQKKPPIPEKMELLSLGEPNYTRHQWFAYIQDRIRAFKKALRMKGSDQRIGMSEPMIKRRTEALLDSMPYIEKRYGALPGLQPSVSNSLGKAWVHMNILASSTYNALASDFYLLYAAALWILDQLEDVPGAYWTIQKYLPKDEDALAELDWPPFWDASYDIRLIQSVEYALENRNADIAPLEIDATQNRRVFNSDLTAKGKHHEDVESRRNFEIILNLIPQERIEMTEPVFEKVCGNAPLTASNLIDTKTVVASAGITVNIKPSAADKIRTSVIDGRKCLLIDIDDPTIEINGPG